MNAKSVHARYLELSKFLKELIGKQHRAGALDHLPEDLADLFVLMEENKVIDQELIIDHASLLLDDKRAHTQFEIHRLLKKELPSGGQLKKALTEKMINGRLQLLRIRGRTNKKQSVQQEQIC